MRPARIAVALLPLFHLAAAAAGGQSAAARVASRPIEGLDAYIRKAVDEWRIPGLAIAVVEDDSVVFLEGYGVREVGKAARVTPHTLFAIGSNTKLFTAVAVGMAVDDGKVAWDAPLTTYLPWFQLYDPYVTREFTVRDALSHRSGLGPVGTELFYGTTYSRDEIVRRARALKPTSSFRAEYGYQNIMVVAAGQALAAADGKSWDDFLARRIFGPLGMRASNTSVTALRAHDDVASPHVWRGDRFEVVPYRNVDNMAPSGSINSTAADMAQWMRMLLAGGKYAGRELVKGATMEEITTPQTIRPVRRNPLQPSTHFSLYGLGVGMRDYLGAKVLEHDGSIDGMVSWTAWVPERGLGLVILTNAHGHNLAHRAISDRILDAYLGAPARLEPDLPRHGGAGDEDGGHETGRTPSGGRRPAVASVVAVRGHVHQLPVPGPRHHARRRRALRAVRDL
jgi:CubicO group peptidase (beta-lactamase class C family)